MRWTDKIDKFYLLNLDDRPDRLLDSVQILDEYELPYNRFVATKDEQGARGLRDSMIAIFNEAISNNYQNIVVFEDDIKMVVPKPILDDVMDKVFQQLPENYWIFYFGGQPSAGFSNYFSHNLFPAVKYFSTHAVMYSIQGVREIMARNFGYPIDNWFVEELQTSGRCYAVNPLLITQRPGYSSINQNEINWDAFISARYEQKINELNARIRH